MSETRENASVAEGPSPLSPGKKLAFALMTLVFFGGLLLGVMEMLVRLFMPQPLAGQMYSEKPEYGFWNRLDMENRRFQSEEAAPPYRVSTNALGLRERKETAIPKPEKVYRLLVLGDSFVYGVGVDNGETFPSQLEAALQSGKCAPPPPAEKWEVLNGGCPGWGTENALAFWEDQADALAPDALLLCFFRNDLQDNLRELVFRNDETGKLVFGPSGDFARKKRLTRYIPFYGFLTEHSHLANLARRVVAGIIRRQIGKRQQKEQLVYFEKAKAAQRKGGGKNEKSVFQGELHPDGGLLNDPVYAPLFRRWVALMEKFMVHCENRGIPLWLLMLPGDKDVVKPGKEYREALRLARKWDATGRLKLWNGRQAFADAPKPLAQYYIPVDGHWNALGNQRVGKALARELCGGLRP